MQCIFFERIIFLDEKTCALCVIEGKRVKKKKSLTGPSSFVLLFLLLVSSLFLSPPIFHCGQCQISIWGSFFHLSKDTHQQKVLVLLKFFSENLQSCQNFHILDLGFFNKLSFFWIFGWESEVLQLLITINLILLNCESCQLK